MAALGDYFPQEIKDAYAKRAVEIGSVLKCFTTNTKPPKEKRIIIIGKNDKKQFVGVVFINTEINYNAINTEELLTVQHEIKKEGNTYLDYDSTVDCSRLTKETISDIEEYIKTKPQNVLGKITKDDYDEIIKKLKISPLIAKYQLNEIGLS